jgi:hypothetical protein
MANFNLTVKGTVKSDDDFRIQLELLQPSCTENDKVVTISSASKVKSNGQVVKAYVIPRNPSNFPGGSVDFSLYESNVPSDSYVKALIVINSVDGVDVYFGTPAASAELASEPNSLSYHIAIVTLRKIGSVLQNITNADIIDRRPLNQINGAPVYYAAGDEIATEQFLVQIADSFVGLPNTLDNSIDFTANRASVSQYASPNLITAKFSVRTGSFSGNAVSLDDAPSFSIRPNCWVRVGQEFRRITNISSQTEFEVSSDFLGASWINESDIEQLPWVDVVYGQSKFFAVSTTGKIANSEDGLSWTEKYTSSYHFNKIIYTGSILVAVANDGVIVHSNDEGENWNVVTTGLEDFYSVVFDGTNYIIVSSGNVYTYDSVFTLSNTVSIPQTLLQTSGNNKYYTSNLIKKITYGNGLYVIVTDEFKEYETVGSTTVTNLYLSYIWTSNDGTTWSRISTPWKTSFNYSSFYVNYADYLNGVYLVGGNFGTYKSSDGSSWSFACAETMGASYGLGIYLLISSNISYFSEDLITFSETTLAQNNWKASSFNGQIFLAVGTSGNYRSMFVDLSTTTFAIYEPIPTKDLYQNVGDESQGTRVIDNFSELVTSLILDYDDSSSVDDGQYDSGSNNIIALVSTDDEDDFVTFLRPLSKAGELTEIVMPNPAQNLKITFLPFHYVGDGQVNLLGYSCFFIKDVEQYKGGIFNQALGFTNESSGLNMDIGLFNNRTLITFKDEFSSYVTGINSSSPYGDLIVQEQGAEIPRRLVGVTDDTLPYYEELSPNQILLWDNLSNSVKRRMISVVRRYGTIDTNDQNSSYIQSFKAKGSPVLYSVTQAGCNNGDVVYFNGTQFVKALADDISNADIVGVIFNVSGTLGDVAISGKIENVFTGLVVGNPYFLSQVDAGQIITPKPSSGLIVKVGFATSSNTLVLDVKEFFDLPQADAIVGSSTQLANGQATHTSLTTAISDIPVDGKILILRGTFTGNIDVNKRCSIEGQGYGSNFSGNITVSTDYVTLKNVRFGGNLTVSGNSNFIQQCFVSSTSTISNTGTNNLVQTITG